MSLEVGAVGQSVEVTANTQMVETRETSQSTVIDQARITELPLNGRQVTQLIVLAGGAVPSRNGNLATSKNYPTSVTLSVSGGQGDGTNYILDGGDHNDAFSNVNQPFPFPDALQEFSVQTSTLSARYGLHPGATVNAVTKSGTNQTSRKCFRVPAQRIAERAELLRRHPRHFEAEPVRRHAGRSDSQRQVVFLRRLSGDAEPAGASSVPGYPADRGGAEMATSAPSNRRAASPPDVRRL